MIKKVGVVYEKGRKPFSYPDIEYDHQKWADASRYLPAEFDLVKCKTEENKILYGWYTGCGWDGYRLEKKHEIVSWKSIYEK